MASAGVAPHDLRSHVRSLVPRTRAELEQIQFLLGHVSVQTTERYLGCKQRLRNAINDSIGIEPGQTPVSYYLMTQFTHLIVFCSCATLSSMCCPGGPLRTRERVATSAFHVVPCGPSYPVWLALSPLPGLAFLFHWSHVDPGDQSA